MAKKFEELIASISRPVPTQKLVHESEEYVFDNEFDDGSSKTSVNFTNSNFYYHTIDSQFKQKLKNFIDVYNNWFDKYDPIMDQIYDELDESGKQTIDAISEQLDVMSKTISIISKDLYK